jgi:hypothetical protein
VCSKERPTHRFHFASTTGNVHKVQLAMTEKSQGGMAKALEPFVCGGAAATFASVFIHPIDLAKVGNAILV